MQELSKHCQNVSKISQSGLKDFEGHMIFKSDARCRNKTKHNKFYLAKLTCIRTLMVKVQLKKQLNIAIEKQMTSNIDRRPS